MTVGITAKAIIRNNAALDVGISGDNNITFQTIAKGIHEFIHNYQAGKKK